MDEPARSRQQALVGRRTLLVSAAAAVTALAAGCTDVAGRSASAPIGPSPTASAPIGPAPTGPVPEPPFFGLDVPRARVAEVVRLTRVVGCGPVVLNQFVKLDSAFQLADLRATAGTARTPMISLEPWPWRLRSGDVDQPAYRLQALLEGRHDKALRRIAGVLSAYGRPVLLRFAHEMNADWYPWAAAVNGNSAAEYVAAWRHVHHLVSRSGAQVRWVWSPVAAWWQDQAPLGPLYPGDEYVDLVGATGYGHAGTNVAAPSGPRPRQDTAEETFGQWYQQVRAITTRPAVLAETGADGPGKAAWTASLATFLGERPDIAGFVWFSDSPETTGATGDYRLDEGAAHLVAFRALVASTHARCAPVA